jgi:predicted MFS family arabinose efflux permease
VAAAALAIAIRKVPESRNPSVGRPDFAGAALATGGLGALVFGLIEAPSLGAGDARVLASVFGGAAALALFFAVERKRTDAMLSTALFRVRSFAAANLLTFFLYAALSAAFFFLPFELIQARGYSPAAAGAALLPLVLAMFLLSRWSGALADRFGARLPLTLGPAVASAGFLMLALFPRSGPYVRVLLPPLAALGLGMAITVAPLTAAVLNAVGRNEEGAASGINNAVARVASLLAIAVFGIVATAQFNRALDQRIASSGISPDARTALAGQKSRLGAIEPPAGVGAAEAETIRRSVAESLDASFRVVAISCAGLALVAAFFGAWGTPLRRAAARERPFR